jgi:hypothetical protein
MAEEGQIAFRAISIDATHEIATRHRVAVPVAFGQSENGVVIRYICPDCRLVWDTGYSNDMAPLFTDRFVRQREQLKSHPGGGMDWIAGPSDGFTRE